MIVAAVTVHWAHGLFAQNNGIELPLLYGTVAAGLALTGPGALSLDSLFGFTEFSSPLLAWAALIAAVVGAFGNLALRRVPAAVTA